MTRLEDYVIVMALGNLSYQFEDADPKLSRIAWKLAAEYGITPSEAVAVSAFDMSRALLPDRAKGTWVEKTPIA